MDVKFQGCINFESVDFGKIEMNRLPKAIQNEIYEFARGDRKYWKEQFTKVVDRLEVLINRVEQEIYFGNPPINRTKRILRRSTGATESPKWNIASFYQKLSQIGAQRYADSFDESNVKWEYRWMLMGSYW